jgi:hypothetical protein
LCIDTVLIPGLANDSAGVVELGALVEMVVEIAREVTADDVGATGALLDGTLFERWSDEHPAAINAARISVVDSRAVTDTVCRASRRWNRRIGDGVLVP